MKPRAHVLNLTPYVGSNTAISEDKRPLILSQNESMYGYSPMVDAAIQQAHADMPFYAKERPDTLCRAIAHAHKLDPEKIVLGLGSTDLIIQLCMLYLEPGRSLVASEYGYIYIRKAVGMAGGELILSEEPDLATKSVDNLLAAVRPDTTMLFLDNPGNPTGALLPRSEIIRLLDNLSPDVLLILDEAYAEYADPEVYGPNFDLVDRGNVVVLRTMSKVYGMAGMRVGWGYFPPQIVDYIGRIRPRHTNSVLAMAAAEAAVLDQEHVFDVREKTAVVRQTFSAQLASLGLTPLPSHTSFVLCHFGTTAAAESAESYLRHQGIVIRPVDGYGLTDYLRITMGTAEQMETVYQALRAWKTSQH